MGICMSITATCGCRPASNAATSWSYACFPLAAVSTAKPACCSSSRLTSRRLSGWSSASRQRKVDGGAACVGERARLPRTLTSVGCGGVCGAAPPSTAMHAGSAAPPPWRCCQARVAASHSAATAGDTCTGKRSVNAAPRPGSLTTLTSPPARRAPVRAMNRPRPVPPPLAEDDASYASNTCSQSCSVRPRPRSVTVACRVCVAGLSAAAATSPPPASTPAVQLMWTVTPSPFSNLAAFVTYNASAFAVSTAARRGHATAQCAHQVLQNLRQEGAVRCDKARQRCLLVHPLDGGLLRAAHAADLQQRHNGLARVERRDEHLQRAGLDAAHRQRIRHHA